MAVMRFQIADYIGIDSKKGAELALMGAGFTALDENPNAQSESVVYISDKSTSKSVTGYEFVFPYTSRMMLEAGAEEEAIKSIYTVHRSAATGAAAERDYVRVDLFDPVGGKDNVFKARMFRTSVETTSVSGEGAKEMEMSGNLNGVGDPIEGTFDTTTKKFTPDAGTANP